MAVLPIVKIGHPALRKKAAPVRAGELQSKAFQEFLQAMVETMREAEGVGLAANQVARSFQAFVLECQHNPRYPEMPAIPLEIYLNCRIVKMSKQKEEGWEGCLSIPGYRGAVPRAKEVTFEALTPEGEKVKKTVQGFHARIIQHEVDHLQGLFYVDRMGDLMRWMHLDEFNHETGSEVLS